MIKLYRPVGLKEMELILNKECKGFPSRLPTQPYFYPVLNSDYAKQIASKWNTVDKGSGFVGYVTEFSIDKKYIEKYQIHTVGAALHRELWVPADELVIFNQNIIGDIMISQAYYGIDYVGLTPLPTILRDKGINEQLLTLKSLMNYNIMDFRCEVALQWKMIILNILLWLKKDMSSSGLFTQEKKELLNRIYSVLVDNKKNYISFAYDIEVNMRK